uniref:Uncharacterized protein n=1 Tax=Oryza meridionalis TaxID=40149 RepID=A0A0E0D003_9ORYZ
MSSVAFVGGSRMSRQASLAPPPSPLSRAGFSSVDQGGRFGHHRQPNKLPSPIPNLHPSPRKSAFTTSTLLLAPISPSPLDGDSKINKTVTTSCGWAEGLRRPPLGYCRGWVEATATSSSSYSSSTAVMLPMQPKCSTTMRMMPGHPPPQANEVGGVERRLAVRSLSSLL